jgi:hypothetical protein
VRGRLDKRDDNRVGFMAMDITVLEGLRAFQDSLHLKIAAQILSESNIETLKATLLEYPGTSPVYLHLGPENVLRLSSEFNVNVDRAIGVLRTEFGENAYIE